MELGFLFLRLFFYLLYYSKKAVEDVQKTGRICVLDLELQGVFNIKQSHLDARFILVRAPTLEILVRMFFLLFFNKF